MKVQRQSTAAPSSLPVPGPLPSMIAIAFVAFAQASCAAPVPDVRSLSEAPAAAETPMETSDQCAPGATVTFEENPKAMCALKTETPEEIAATTAPSSGSGFEFSGWSGPGLGPRAPTPASIPSCGGQAGPGINTCGPNGNESCCTNAVVPEGVGSGGALNAAYTLDVYEVTVGRFETFVNKFGGNLRGAATGGAIPGWNNAWNASLPASRAELDTMVGPECKSRSDVRDFGARTWPSPDIVTAVNELVTDNTARAIDIRADATADRLRAKPMNCVTYYLAAAFCQWDGGALPTNKQWGRAARGGAEARVFPWGLDRTANRLVTMMNKEDGSTYTFPEDFPFGGNGMNAYHIAPPGRKPAGVAKWGHHDMAGNLLEWVKDIDANGAGIVRGGSWEGHQEQNDQMHVNYPLTRSYGSAGMRCARP